MKMPASTMDLVGAALKSSLSKNEECSSLDAQLAGSTKKALLGTVEFDPPENYRTTVLDGLKTKYIRIVLRNQESSSNSAKTEEEPQGDDSLTLANQELYPLDKIKLGWSHTNDWTVGAGMVNMGNTCYLNSTLQALFHVPSLVNWLVSDKEHSSECLDTGMCIICAMRKTLLESQQRNISSIRPILIYNKLRLVCRNLIPGRQEDAHEFLRYLVEAMEKSYLHRYRNHTQFDSKVKETTPLNQILGGYLRSAVRCLRCGHVSTTFQHFQDLLLDIRKAQTLEEALEGYFSREKLDDESYHCESCQKKVQATKQFQLERAPMVLCIQLKRFSISNNKITKHVAFRQRLDLTRYSRQKPGTPLVYRLVALVTHMGPTVSCGHYTAVAQAPSGNFYQFDDSMVRPISHQNVFNTNAYIMLYELETAPPKPATVNLKSKATSTVTEACSSKRVVEEAAPRKTLGIGFTSDKVYGPELPPIRANASSSLTNGNKSQGKAVSSTSVRATLTVPELTDESSSSESSETEGDPQEATPPSPDSNKEPDSSTTNEQPATPSKKTAQSPEASPTSSSAVSTSVSSLSSPEADTSKTATSPSKSLVPYETGDTSCSDDSNHSDRDGRNRETLSSSVAGEWQVSSTTESGWEDKKNGNVVNELFKMSTSGYSAPVSTWNGTRSQLDKEVHQERREERKRTLADSSEDQSAAKRPKVTSTFKGKSNPGYNPVQEYHNNVNKGGWNNGYHHGGNNNKGGYFHGNRHKRNFHSTKGAHNKNYRFR